MSDKPQDPNPVFQSIVETARQVWAKLIPGEQRDVQCSRSLLDRSEQGPGAYERLSAWAQPLGFAVRSHQPSKQDGSNRTMIAPPEVVIITIHRK